MRWDPTESLRLIHSWDPFARHRAEVPDTWVADWPNAPEDPLALLQQLATKAPQALAHPRVESASHACGIDFRVLKRMQKRFQSAATHAVSISEC